MYRAHRRFIGHRLLSQYPNQIVKNKSSEGNIINHAKSHIRSRMLLGRRSRLPPGKRSHLNSSWLWDNHDPTTMNRQGPDIGSQYRSVIFYHTPEQQAAAEASRQKLADRGRYRRPIVTQIVPASTFYRAEDYHQQYLEKRGLSTCNL